MIPRWKDAIAADKRLSIPDAMQQEIDALRSSNKSEVDALHTTINALQREVKYRCKDVEMLQQENIEQWDELVQLRNDAEQHEEIVAIYLNKITRLKNERHQEKSV